MAKRSPKASTEITAYDREAKAVEMRAAGHGFQSIASTLGYSDASGASKAYHRALARKPAQNVNEIRAQEGERLEYLWAVTAKTIENPGPRVSAIGKVAVFPPGHERAGEIVPDESVRLRAAHEYRLQSESYRKLTGADIAGKQDESAEYDKAMMWVESVLAESRVIKSRCAQLESECARLRAQLGHQDDIVEAELV